MHHVSDGPHNVRKTQPCFRLLKNKGLRLFCIMTVGVYNHILISFSLRVVDVFVGVCNHHLLFSWFHRLIHGEFIQKLAVWMHSCIPVDFFMHGHPSSRQKHTPPSIPKWGSVPGFRGILIASFSALPKIQPGLARVKDCFVDAILIWVVNST